MADKTKLLKIAQKHLLKGNLDKAISTFEELVNLDPRDQRLLLRLAELQARVGRKKEAIQNYEKIAAGYISQDFTPKAIAVYKTILRLDPELITAYEKLAQLYKSQGLEVEALSQLENLFNFFEKKGEAAKQIEVLKLMADMDPENLGFQVRLGEMLAKKGMKDEAAEAFARAGSTLSRRGFHDRASQLFEKIISLNPENISVRKELCAHYLECGEFARAQKEVEAILERAPDDPRMVLLLGRILLQLEKRGEGEKSIAQAIMLFKETGELEHVMKEFLFVAQSHLNNGEIPEAEIFYRQIFQADPTEDRTVRGLIKIAEMRKDRASRIENLALLGRILRDRGDGKGARKVYQELHQLDLLNQEAREFLEEYDQKEPGIGQWETREPEGAEEGEKLQIDGSDLLPPEFSGEEEDEGEEGVDLELFGDEEVLTPEFEGFEGVFEGEEDLPRPPAAEEPGLEEAEAEGGFGIEAEADEAPDVPDILLEDFSEGLEIVPEETSETAESGENGEFVQGEMVGEVEASVEDLLAESEIYRKYGLTDQLLITMEKLRAVAGSDPATLQKIRVLEEEAETTEDVEESTPAQPDAVAGDFLFEGMGSDLFEEEKPPSEEGPVFPEEFSAEGPPADSETGDLFQEEFEEAEFYLSQGMEEEAARIYRSILSRAPDHPQARATLEGLGRRGGQAEDVPAQAASGLSPDQPPSPAHSDVGIETKEPDREVSRIKEPLPAKESAASAGKGPDRGPDGELRTKLVVEDRTSEDAGGFLDLADELRSALSDEFDTPREAAPQTAPVTFEEVFAQFKKGIEEVLGEEEYETHYNLGIAYKDMGLFDDALKEFEVAAREPGLTQDCLSLMVMCFLEKKDFDSAIKVAQRALEEASEPSKAGFFYQLGEAYAGNREWSKALAAYGEVKSRDPSFDRIDDILQKIRSMAGKETPADPDTESASEPGMDEMLSDLIREVEEMARESTGKKEEQPKGDTGRDPKDRISYL